MLRIGLTLFKVRHCRRSRVSTLMTRRQRPARPHPLGRHHRRRPGGRRAQRRDQTPCRKTMLASIGASGTRIHDRTCIINACAGVGSSAGVWAGVMTASRSRRSKCTGWHLLDLRRFVLPISRDNQRQGEDDGQEAVLIGQVPFTWVPRATEPTHRPAPYGGTYR